jgi:hypothetical protein
MLVIVIVRGKYDGQIGGLVPHLVDSSLSILQYNYDTIWFTETQFSKGS